MARSLSESHCTVQPGVKISLYTRMQQIQYFIFITQYLLQVVFCQRVLLFPYNKTKNCKMSLVEEMDRIVIYGKVDFNGNILASSDVNFEIKGKTETSFQFISFVKIPKDCDKVFHFGNCLKTYDPKVFLLSLNISAHELTSEADVRAELVYRETTFYSEIIKLPKVYDSETDMILVYANDQVVSFQKTDVSINDTHATLLATCPEKFAQDCKLQLIDLETGALVKSKKKIVVYNTNIKGRSKFKLTYSVCNIVRNISFSITTDVHLTAETGLMFIIVLTINILIVAGMFYCCYITRRNIYIHDDNNNEHRNPIYQHQKKMTVDFTDVPIRYRENELIKLLEILSQLSCRVALKKKSLSNGRELSQKLGCALVTSVLKYCCGVGIETVKGSQTRVCPCPKCLKSKSASDTWAEIFITTTSAMIKKKNYHKQIMCELCTEDNVTTELRDLSVEHKDPEKTGRCVLKYVTCDEALINKLQVLQKERFRLEEKVQEIFHQHKENNKIYFALVYREDGTKHLRTGLWFEGKTRHNVRTYHYLPEILHGNIGAPVVLMGYGDYDKEYNHTRNILEDVSCNNFSTSVYSTEIVQKIKIQ